MTDFADHMAARVLELEAALRAAKRRNRELLKARDLWRIRALKKARLA